MEERELEREREREREMIMVLLVTIIYNCLNEDDRCGVRQGQRNYIAGFENYKRRDPTIIFIQFQS